MIKEFRDKEGLYDPFLIFAVRFRWLPSSGFSTFKVMILIIPDSIASIIVQSALGEYESIMYIMEHFLKYEVGKCSTEDS